jgi:hypothetical protein
MRYKPVMIRTTKKTTVAVLRSIIGLKAKCFADVLGCSEATVNSLETGRLKLSEAMAQRIFHETGVSLPWLLNGDVSALVVTGRGEPFTAETFERAQAEKKHFDKVQPWFFATDFAEFAGRLRGILASANRAGNYFMPAYKVGKFLDALAKEYGEDGESRNWLKVHPALLADIAEADRIYSTVALVSTPGGHDVAELHKAFAPKPPAKPTKKGEPVKARPKSRKRKG